VRPEVLLDEDYGGDSRDGGEEAAGNARTMSAYWWLSAVGLVFGFTFAHSMGTRLVQRFTGRE